MVDELERLRLQRILSDWITGLPLYPVADLRNERVSHLGVIYLQLGRFAGVESVYGWELYDQVLRCVTESLQADVEASTLRSSFLSIQFTGCDGFYLLFDVAPAAATRRCAWRRSPSACATGRYGGWASAWAAPSSS